MMRKAAIAMFARYLIATLSAAFMFVIVGGLIGAVFGQMLSDIPARQAAIPIIGELALPLAVAIYTFRAAIKMPFRSESKGAK
jgi:hypothetical protein